MSNQPETEAINRVFFHEWFPQIVYNHHQTGPAGTVLFAPPFATRSIIISTRLCRWDSTWSARRCTAGLSPRTNPERRCDPERPTQRGGTAGCARSPIFTIDRAFDRIDRQPHADGDSFPVATSTGERGSSVSGRAAVVGTWQSIDYSITANRAVLDVASKHREDFLFNLYRMGKNSIERGSRDHWTTTPKRIAEVQAATQRICLNPAVRVRVDAGRAGGDARRAEIRRRGLAVRRAASRWALRNAACSGQTRPKRFIIPSNQTDFLTATKFINVLTRPASRFIARPPSSRLAARVIRPGLM